LVRILPPLLKEGKVDYSFSFFNYSTHENILFFCKRNSKKIKITESHLKKFDKKNAEFFNYLTGEDADEMRKTTEIVLETIDSKAILTALIYRVNEKSVFKKMNQDRKSESILELKTLIKCFEEINK
jgi:hypothetical protein